MNKFILGLFGRLGPVLARLGVDREAFLAILEVKLLQDQRRTISGLGNQNPKKKPRRAFQMGMITYAFVGIFIALPLFWIESPLVGLSFVNSFVMLMMGFLMVADFTNVLMDTTDNTVLLPRPVSSRTLLAVRTAHIVIYLGMLSLALSAGTLVVGSITYHPLFAPVFFVTLVLSLLLIVFLVFLFYLAAMRFLDMERFRDVILYFQIGMTVFLFGFYQVVPRVTDLNAIKNLTIHDRWWIYLSPPTWMAAPVDLLTIGWGGPAIVLTVLAGLVPILCLIFVIRVLAPGFTQILSSMESSAAAQEGARARGERLGTLARFYSRLCNRSGEERAAFDMLWSTAGRDRTFKLGTYPSMAMVLLVSGLMFFTELKDNSLDLLGQSDLYIFILYFSCFVAPVALLQMRYSEFHQASWIFQALPLQKPGAVLTAGLKVALLRFAVPLYLIIAVFVVSVWGPGKLWDIGLGGLVMVGFSLVTAFSLNHVLPFSQARVAQSASQGAAVMMLMVFLGLAGLGHWGLTQVPYGVPGGVALLLVMVMCGFSRYRRISWDQVKQT